jgi:hypothetical protein
MRIGLIDIDSKVPNLALMKISSFHKSVGNQVEFVKEKAKYDKIYASSVFTRSKDECQKLLDHYGDIIEIGGTGWDISKKLEHEIERMKPDYDLYSVEMIARRIKGICTKEHRLEKAMELVNGGMGYSSRGCIRSCGFCVVPKAEGEFRQEHEIKDLINPKSNILILHDNNFTADPLCIEKLHEIRERNLVVDINQGCDIRLMNEDIALAMSQVKHLRSIHYSWDLIGFEDQVIEGIKILSRFIRPYRHMCFMLTGFSTSFQEDVYRFRKLIEMGVDPFVMVYNQIPDEKLQHFQRWVNSRIYKKCTFEEYIPWVKSQQQLSMF